MLNLNMENVSVKAVLSSIEDQSEFYFYHRVILVKNIEISAYGGKKMCKGSQAYI
jgi:hypothetical protein